MSIPSFVITTSPKPLATQVERAQILASRFGVDYVARQRDSLTRLRGIAGVEMVYSVRRDREEVQASGERRLFVHPGLFFLKRASGRDHPLLNAISPPNRPPIDTVVDATLGLAGDALHLAGSLPDLRVIGFEESPVIHALLEEGLPRLAATPGHGLAQAAMKIGVHFGDALHLLGGMETDSADVVFLDPMFESPRSGSGTFPLFRRFAVHRPLDERHLREAKRVARQRVVLKVPAGTKPPKALAPSTFWSRCVYGDALDYWIAGLES